ncbi:MAG: peroxidase [Thiothrix sp.]|nr:MAG: peroxidase [Thiothrix sp.]
MSSPQSGILPEGSQHALFITLKAAEGSESLLAIRDLCPMFEVMTDKVAALDESAKLISVLGFGDKIWGRLFPTAKPKQLKSFEERQTESRRAPSTPGDILLHIRSERPDLNFILARQVVQMLAKNVSLVEEIMGFRYLDSRDLTGFVDGTENPEGAERTEVALVGEEDKTFSGGSYIQMQRYVHDLAGWDTLPVTEQEAKIGRTKADDIELSDDIKPLTAHISRVVINEDGEELEILRHSMPYGNSEEAGLLFIAYARTPAHFDRMLDRMIYSDEQGGYDHLLDYTRAVTGVSFFAPSAAFLQAV